MATRKVRKVTKPTLKTIPTGQPPIMGNTSAQTYLEATNLVGRLNRLVVDVVTDELARLGILEISATQALLLFRIGDNEVSAGELKSRGYYLGSNVSYNLKKLVDSDHMHHQRCDVDRRSVRVRLTNKGQKIRQVVHDLFARHAEELQSRSLDLARMVDDLTQLERYWTDRIRYIY